MMIKTYEKYLENKKFKNVSSNYNKVSNMIKPYYNKKLGVYILPYYKLFYFLSKNSNYNLNTYQLILLIILSFSRLLNDNEENINLLINKIKEQNIYELNNSFFLILKNIYIILRIINKTLNDKSILFNKDNLILINYLIDFIKNKKINIIEFNSMKNNKLKNELLTYLTI